MAKDKKPPTREELEQRIKELEAAVFKWPNQEKK